MDTKELAVHTGDNHRFIDEAGDMTFFSSKRGSKTSLIGDPGVSRCFMVGMVHVKGDLAEARSAIKVFCEMVDTNEFFQSFPSVASRTEKGWQGYYPHASKDPAELRYEFLKLMKEKIDFSAQIVVGRKLPDVFLRKHQRLQREFYADLMSHLLKYTHKIDPLILDIAERGSSTSNMNLQHAVDVARERSRRGTLTKEMNNKVKFNVQPYDHELLLSLTDYCLWSAQRVFEKGDTKYYKLLESKIKLVHDVYDQSRYEKSKNYYRTKYNPLTAEAIGFADWRKPEWPEP
ncbi:hypothetical protein [Bifidobacterium oedipodis]|uniref:DUF3800 domain-containing protein n=1 Tax=Bifidobacterium oedipodis TaxID=2675322 RepID=A0A7Y0EQR0_9BIFI|nr:hypothetical protein [Bifidobacterium sp. DSM 109957]NMM94700.1 hypothetical protein [Bifidobacterium sp. DSM 109957]